MFIIKLGGSVITNKAQKCCFLHKIMDNLSSEIKQSDEKIIIIHGAGSFGHVLAKQYSLNSGYKNSEQSYGFALTHAMVQQLNTLVLNSLHKNNINAISIPPHATIKLENHKLHKIDYRIFSDYLDNDFIPLTFGDVVLDSKLGFSICSGDLLVLALAEYFKPEKVIFVIDEDGLYTSNPKIDRNAKLIEKTTINDLINLSTSMDKHDDVTGGMKGKIDTIKAISNLGIDTVILNGNKKDRLYNTMIDKPCISTTVVGGKT